MSYFTALQAGLKPDKINGNQVVAYIFLQSMQFALAKLVRDKEIIPDNKNISLCDAFQFLEIRRYK